MVVYDLNNNGKIDDISETLSEYFNGAVGTGGNAGEKKYANGLAALKSLDSNNDNQFTSADAAWANVKVWTDANHDGKSYIDANNNGFFDAGETSELHTLTELGITAINLTQTSQSGLVRDGNEVLATSTFIQNGQTKEALAANFIANPNGSTFTASGSGTITQTEGNISSYSAAYPISGTLGETIDVAQKGVNNALGGSGNDTLIGDAGNNWLSGGLGADSLSAGAGDDVLLIDANDSHIDGGDGNDLAQVVGDAGVTLNLAQSHIEGVQGGRGDDFIYGGGNRSVFVRGGDGDDVLNGENGSDLIDGGAGNDILRGGRGEDRVVGGAGDDLIYGGQDDDKLYGGLGNDVLNGAQGDDLIDGGDGTDIVELSGSFADYRITQLKAVRRIRHQAIRHNFNWLSSALCVCGGLLARNRPTALNASAVSGNSTINLNNGTTSTIAGRNLTINGDVEFAFGGDDGTDLFKVLEHISLMRRMARTQINRRNTLRYSDLAIHRSSATKNVIPIAKVWTLN